MAVDARVASPVTSTKRTAKFSWPHWSKEAYASIALCVLFVSVTGWWLSNDGSIPVDDAALHLASAIDAYEALSSGHLLKALTGPAPYPPLTFLVGALGIVIGGVGVTAPIIAQNLVFVPLLVLGCYRIGRLAFGPLAGLLAVVFALGAPLIVEEFHEFMLDAPEAAMVAVAVWAILATERFSRPGVSALAGVAVGLGMLSKETFVFFVAGVALATAVRGGRRAWRGVAVFAAVSLLIALPWYLGELSVVHTLGSEALSSSRSLSAEQFTGIAPPRLSSANLEWYLWSFQNALLYLPLFAFSVAGGIWVMVGFARRRPVSRFAPELAFGAIVAWAALTETYVHDDRYGTPILVYLAVFGVGWVSRLRRFPRAVVVAVLVLSALANSLGVGFGVGKAVITGWGTMASQQWPGSFTLYEDSGVWVGAPVSDGNMLALLRALRRSGIREVRWYSDLDTGANFSVAGITVLARIAGLGVASNAVNPAKANHDYAFFLYGVPAGPALIPCTHLQDGAGVWVRLGGARGAGAWSYCPSHFS